jgi:hypothetical protein
VRNVVRASENTGHQLIPLTEYSKNRFVASSRMRSQFGRQPSLTGVMLAASAELVVAFVYLRTPRFQPVAKMLTVDASDSGPND